eukprot:5182856-Ditylum_brightwellii.AAC.1
MEFLEENNLDFKHPKDHQGNNLQSIASSQKNIPIKNATRELKKYTGIYINLLTDKENNQQRKRGEWNNYFLKWEAMADVTTIEEAFNTVKKLQWNIKSKKDDIVVYNNTPEKNTD